MKFVHFLMSSEIASINLDRWALVRQSLRSKSLRAATLTAMDWANGQRSSSIVTVLIVQARYPKRLAVTSLPRMLVYWFSGKWNDGERVLARDASHIL